MSVAIVTAAAKTVVSLSKLIDKFHGDAPTPLKDDPERLARLFSDGKYFVYDYYNDKTTLDGEYYSELSSRKRNAFSPIYLNTRNSNKSSTTRGRYDDNRYPLSLEQYWASYDSEGNPRTSKDRSISDSEGKEYPDISYSPSMYYYDEHFNQISGINDSSFVVIDAKGLFSPRGSHFSRTGLYKYCKDFDHAIRDAIIALNKPNDWKYCSESLPSLVWTPNGWVATPMTFYDNEGNYYLLDQDSDAKLVVDTNSNPTSFGDVVDTRASYSSFAGISLKNWVDAQANVKLAEEAQRIEEVEQEKKGLEEQLKKQQEDEQLSDEKRKRNRKTYIALAVCALLFTGYYFFFIKSKKH